MLSSRVPVHRCNNCQSEFDAATSLTNDVKPKPGDLTICIECGQAHQFQADFSLASCTLESVRDNLSDTDYRLVKSIQERYFKFGRA